jgi:hypothetical protein
MSKVSGFALFLVFALLASCGGWKSTDVEEKVKDEWSVAIDEAETVHAIQHYLAYLRHEKHLRLENACVWYRDNINSVRMEFTSQDVLEVREARFLLVDLVEGLLAELNRNPVIAPSLVTFPLMPEHLEIYINFESYHGLYVDPYYVGYIKLENGEASYLAFDIKAPGRNNWDFRTESYAKSREFTVYEREAEKLFKESVDLQRLHKLTKEQYFPVDKEVPRYYSPYEREKIFDY